MVTRCRWLGSLTLLAVLLLCSVSAAEAASFTVNRTDDLPDASSGGACDVDTGTAGDQCTLRAAVQAANASGAGPHTITLPAGTFTLTRAGLEDDAFQGDLDVTTSVTITGAGAQDTIIQASSTGSASGIDRVFHVIGGNLTLVGLTVRHGKPVSQPGGGIRNQDGTLTLDRVVIANNEASGGAGISTNGPITITNSTIHNNVGSGGGGGGISILGGTDTATLTNVTISGNSSGAPGGGIRMLAGSTTVTLTNVTLASNTSSAGAAIFRSQGTVLLNNTIVANNGTGGTSTCDGDITSQGFNLIFPGSGCGTFAALEDRIGVDPVLGALAINGGQTPTHEPGSSSGAVDRGNPDTPLDGAFGRCAATDQRGQARPSNGDGVGTAVCDIGAVEARGALTVNTAPDDDDLTPGNGLCDSNPSIGFTCNLRAAIQEANAQGGGVIILPAGTYTLTRDGIDDTALNGDLDITGDVTIVGAGASTTIIQASDTNVSSAIDRIFHVHGGGKLTLSGATVRRGKPSTGAQGGGIFAVGGSQLRLDQVVVTGNSAVEGGGLNLRGPATITNSTIHGNTATTSDGGGIAITQGSVDISLVNVTISGNSAPTGFGGGIDLSVASTVTLTNVTLVNNSANAGGGYRSVSSITPLIVRNTIIANNTAAFGPNCVGPITSQGFNLTFPGSACAFIDASDRNNVDPALGALADNGGPTPTHKLGKTSGAIDRGNPATPLDGTDGRCAATDQRGTARPLNGDASDTSRCDIGAFEAATPAELSVTMSHAGNFVVGQNGVYTITVANAAAAAATTGTVSVIGTLPAGLTFVSGTGTDWNCFNFGQVATCTRNAAIGPATNTVITLTVAVGQAAAPNVTHSVTLQAAEDFSTANNVASDPTTVLGACSARPPVGLQVTQTGPGTGPGLLRATLTANTSIGVTTNALTKVKILQASNAAIDGLNGQNNLTGGEVTLANVPSTSFIVRRLAPGPFTVRIEVTDACGVWTTFVGGGANVP